jgi:lipopolysaccharide/colanic/teichoic acid biosynthesis glycosyltransferase
MIRILDILLSALAFIVLLVPMLIIAAAIWLDDHGPVLFRQTRVGRDGRHFTIFKFRSMSAVASRSSESAGVVGSLDARTARLRFQTTTRNDPRITRIGRILRASHLDELPQLINVMRGDMSLVGVRPDTPSQEADYEPSYWHERHRYRPGITGPAQVRTNDIDLNTRTLLEREWLRSPTVEDYLRILAFTAAKVIKRSSF